MVFDTHTNLTGRHYYYYAGENNKLRIMTKEDYDAKYAEDNSESQPYRTKGGVTALGKAKKGGFKASYAEAPKTFADRAGAGSAMGAGLASGSDDGAGGTGRPRRPSLDELGTIFAPEGKGMPSPRPVD